jgi:predicted nucleotidyltransferase
MRLNDKEIKAITESFREIFNSGELYLFGSRTDDKKKGGDIDLYIRPVQLDNLASKKLDFLVRIKQRIGEQKIDVVIDRGQYRTIDMKAKSEGILLCRN